ncbi:hypothetical protein M8818_001533 [Zalaria obscura]|uniref:Uncharacterized protein n=1 Tax=Zalaria obscura TaxID=2024903 RepID=A0ACC3SKM2_9PEZI
MSCDSPTPAPLVQSEREPMAAQRNALSEEAGMEDAVGAPVPPDAEDVGIHPADAITQDVASVEEPYAAQRQDKTTERSATPSDDTPQRSSNEVTGVPKVATGFEEGDTTPLRRPSVEPGSEHSRSGSSTAGSPQTVEEGESGLGQGFAGFAQWIASDPLRSTTIFRRFDWLAVRNLLYLQSELTYLEAELRRFDKDSDTGRLLVAAKDWNTLCLYAKHGDKTLLDPEIQGRTQAWRDLIIKIRETLKEYRKSRGIVIRIQMLNDGKMKP